MLVRLYTLYRAISSYAGRQERNKKKMDSTWVRDPAHLTSFNLRVGESADFLNRFSCISSKNLWRNMHHWNFDEFLRNSLSKSVNFEESLYFYYFEESLRIKGAFNLAFMNEVLWKVLTCYMFCRCNRTNSRKNIRQVFGIIALFAPLFVFFSKPRLGFCM